MEVEGEVVCAVGIQSVTVEREQVAGVNVKRTSVHPEEILFSTWVRVFQTTCGNEFPVPMGGGGGSMHTSSATTCKRPAKQCL